VEAAMDADQPPFLLDQDMSRKGASRPPSSSRAVETNVATTLYASYERMGSERSIL
jgi:hypothetical protein